MTGKRKVSWNLKILETPEEMVEVQALQRLVWPNSETDVIPLHVLITAAQNGGLVIGAYLDTRSEKELAQKQPHDQEVSTLIGFVWGFSGLYYTPDGPRAKHCSNDLGVHPDYRNSGVGFALKRAQWQMVRHQGLDLITWTYDPLLSRNAYLNITRLGAVCCRYQQDHYGEMKDGLNSGIPSDRLMVDWWVNTQRVQRRLSRRARQPLNLMHFLSAGTQIVNPSRAGKAETAPLPAAKPVEVKRDQENGGDILLVEIPADFPALKVSEPQLALEWRLHTRSLFENLFQQGYWVTDFVYSTGEDPRSFYVFTHGESTLLTKQR